MMRFGRRVLPLVMLLAALAAGGCTSIANAVAKHLSQRQLAKLEQDVMVVEGDVALFRECLKTRGGTCAGGGNTPLPLARSAAPEIEPLDSALGNHLSTAVDTLDPDDPARAARDTLANPMLDQVDRLYNQLTGITPATSPNASNEAVIPFTVKIDDVTRFVDQVGQTTLSGGWDSLADHSMSSTSALQKRAASPEAQAEADQDRRQLVYIRAYLRAYFDNGKFVRLDFKTSDLEARIERYLQEHVPLLCGSAQGSAQCDQIVADLKKDVFKGVAQDSQGQGYLFGNLGTVGFVSRNGRGFRFPGVQITLDPFGKQIVSAGTVEKIDYTTIGSEVLRVLLAAIFDAHQGLPAVPNATGVALGEGREAFNLPVFNPAVGNVDEQDFAAILNVATRTEAITGTAVDRLIRGIGVLSLNNEAIEQLLTTTIAVTAGHAAEQATWCWYACNLDVEVKTAVKKEEARARQFVDRELQRVKVRLRIE